MFAGRVDEAVPSEVLGQRFVPGNIANGEATDPGFALVFAAILGIADDECSGAEASDNLLDPSVGSSLVDIYSHGGLEAVNNIESGTREFHTSTKGYLSGPNLSNLGAESSGSRLDRFTQFNGDTQVESLTRRTISPLAARGPITQEDLKACPSDGADAKFGSMSNKTGVLNKNQLSDWMDAHALSRSSHHCAMYCRLGMEAGGLNTEDRPKSGDAGDYGPFLLRHGAQKVSPDSFVPQVGDVAVFDKTVQHPNGHIEMYDGHHWVSDFMQNSFSPYRDAASTPPFTIYRLS
jgi:hypothetical protein